MPDVPRFSKMFVGVGATIAIAYACGMMFSAVDGTYFRHLKFKNGIALILTTRDGNNNVLVLAWLTCLSESADNYEYFAQKCVEVGLGRYLNKPKSILYSDRAKGVPAFAAYFRCQGAYCFRHIIDNVFDFLRRTAGAKKTFNIGLAWAMQKAETAEEYEAAKINLTADNKHAAKYLDDLPHQQVFLYAILAQGISTMGHKTNNVVECINGKLDDIRWEAPLRFNDRVLDYLGKQISDRHAEIAKFRTKEFMLTPFAQNEYEIQVRAQRAQRAQWARRVLCVPLMPTLHTTAPFVPTVFNGPTASPICSSSTPSAQLCRLDRADPARHTTWRILRTSARRTTA